MSQVVSREIRLAARPAGMPRQEDFELAERTVRAPLAGEILVRNLWMSVDPYMRGRMRPFRNYVEPFVVGEPLEGECLGEVLESRHPGFARGDIVYSLNGWRELWVGPPEHVTHVDPDLAPLSAYLGVMGMPGFTAWIGLREIAGLQPGETVFVSSAAGAVGSVACQIAKLDGCRVIGSAGSPAKTQWLQDALGVDAAINYKERGSLAGALARAAPDGIDVYFDNVGDDHLEAALQVLREHGRVAACGMIATYNQLLPRRGPRNLLQVVVKRLTIRGFLVQDHEHRLPAFHAEMGEWIRAGRITWRETVHEGIASAPGAFIGLFHGENVGKMLVKLDADSGRRRATARA
jgi:NADPH-dependent curcumin reductase CurA